MHSQQLGVSSSTGFARSRAGKVLWHQGSVLEQAAPEPDQWMGGEGFWDFGILDKGFPLPECWALSCHPLEPAPGLLGHFTAPTEPVPWVGDMGTCMWQGDLSFPSGNPNIAPCDQVLAKKWSNPYLGQVQGLKFLTASVPGSAACPG